MEAPLAVTAAWAGGPLGTYLASLPGRHTVLHLHGFDHTDFLTFCYLEKAQRVDRRVKSIQISQQRSRGRPLRQSSSKL